MSLIDGLVVLAIFGAIAFLIISKLNEKNPARVQWFYNFFKGDSKAKEMKDRLEQIYPEKRRIM